MEQYHSRGYHEFFEGYTEEEVIEKGKRCVKRVYTGDWYELKNVTRTEMFLKIMALYLCGIVSYIIAGVQKITSGTHVALDIFEALGLLLFLWLLKYIISLMVSPMPYTIWGYRQLRENISDFTKYAAFFMAVIFGVNILYAVAGYFSGKNVSFKGLGTSSISLVVTFCLLRILYQYLNKIEFTKSPSREIRPLKGTDIRC